MDSKRKIIVVGGYGAVGSMTGRRLAELYPGAVVIAGRDTGKLREVAQDIGHNVAFVQLDADDAGAVARCLKHAAIVVNCVEQSDLTIAKLCLHNGVHYVDVSATASILKNISALHPQAVQSRATGVLSVGVAPGLTNLLAKYAVQQLGPLDRADLFVMLSIRESHGKAGINWTLQNLGRAFSIEVNGEPSEVFSFDEGRHAHFPAPFGRRKAYRFNFSEQHTLPATLNIRSVSSWLCFDSRLLTGLAHLFRRLHPASLISAENVQRILMKTFAGTAQESAPFVVAVDAINAEGIAARYTLQGESEVRVTGLVAASVVRCLMESQNKSGVYHIEQILDIDRLLSELMPGELSFNCSVP